MPENIREVFVAFDVSIESKRPEGMVARLELVAWERKVLENMSEVFVAFDVSIESKRPEGMVAVVEFVA